MMCILSLIKVLMCEFQYYYFKKDMATNQDYHSLYDSLIYEINTKNVYEDFTEANEVFDFSNYVAKSKCYDSNKLVIGKMMDVTGGVAVGEFVGLKPNLYLC